MRSIRPRVDTVYADLRNLQVTARAVRQARPERVIHLAAAGVTDPFLNVNAALSHNVTGTLNLLRACFEGDGPDIQQVIVARTPGERTAMNVYAASKAFVLTLSEALWAENRDRGVRVVALCPGPVDTPFFDVVGREEAVTGPKLPPRYVVATGLRALERGRCYAIPGWRSYFLAHAPNRLLPRNLVARIARRMLHPRGPTPETAV